MKKILRIDMTAKPQKKKKYATSTTDSEEED